MMKQLRDAAAKMATFLQRKQARDTAMENAKTLLVDGYHFCHWNNRPGAIGMIKPGEDYPAYTVQLYRDPITGCYLYECPCAFFKIEKRCTGKGWCKHGQGLILELAKWEPITDVARAAPVGRPERKPVPKQIYATARNAPPGSTPPGEANDLAPEQFPSSGRRSDIRIIRPVRVTDDGFGGLNMAFER